MSKANKKVDSEIDSMYNDENMTNKRGLYV